MTKLHKRIARSRRAWLVMGLAGAAIFALLTLLALNIFASEKAIEKKIAHRYGVSDPQFVRELGTLLGPAIMGGNSIHHLENGAEIFPAMLAALRVARHSITFETFIYWSGEIGEQFAEALAERARAGVKVHVLIDWMGGKQIDEDMLERMEAAGVEVHFFHPLRWYHMARMNNRTHRKLLVVDGRVGFTGGVGIADPWDGNAADPEHWRDSHYRLTGPAVAQMQSAFTDNWTKTTGAVLSGPEYFPPLQPTGDMPAQVFTSSPTGGADSMQLMYLLAIASAEHSIDLAAAYFVPDKLAREALIDAARRGVKVRVLTAGEHKDSKVVHDASRAQWGEFLAAGVKIYQYKPSLFHVKTLIVDRLLVSVGSTNFDNRSFRLNAEANLNVYQDEFAIESTKVFEQDLAKAHEVTLEEWRDRPWTERLMEQSAALFSSQL